jgi:hypothetical protein
MKRRRNTSKNSSKRRSQESILGKTPGSNDPLLNEQGRNLLDLSISRHEIKRTFLVSSDAPSALHTLWSVVDPPEGARQHTLVEQLHKEPQTRMLVAVRVDEQDRARP